MGADEVQGDQMFGRAAQEFPVELEGEVGNAASKATSSSSAFSW